MLRVSGGTAVADYTTGSGADQLRLLYTRARARTEQTRHSLPVGDVGLVIPVLPALQRVDVCVHAGLATGHRTRHGETRGPGARGSAGQEQVV